MILRKDLAAPHSSLSDAPPGCCLVLVKIVSLTLGVSTTRRLRLVSDRRDASTKQCLTCNNITLPHVSALPSTRLETSLRRAPAGRVRLDRGQNELEVVELEGLGLTLLQTHVKRLLDSLGNAGHILLTVSRNVISEVHLGHSLLVDLNNEGVDDMRSIDRCMRGRNVADTDVGGECLDPCTVAGSLKQCFSSRAHGVIRVGAVLVEEVAGFGVVECQAGDVVEVQQHAEALAESRPASEEEAGDLDVVEGVALSCLGLCDVTVYFVADFGGEGKEALNLWLSLGGSFGSQVGRHGGSCGGFQVGEWFGRHGRGGLGGRGGSFVEGQVDRHAGGCVDSQGG